MKIVLIALFVFLNPDKSDFKLQIGDLIFQEACSGEVANAIKDVTVSKAGSQFTHVGIVYIDANDSIFVLEATHPKVVLTPLSPLDVMTFKAPETGEYADGWISYFEHLGIPIPEGEMGINPGGMSRSDVLGIIHYF